MLDEEQADLVKLKVSHKLLAQLTKAGFTNGSLPSHADLVLLPKQIYKYMLKHLVRRAQHWVLKRKPLSQALLHLLQRRSIPALPDLNQRIRSAPERTATELASLMTHAHGVGLSLQGTPGTGKTTVTAALIPQLVHAGQRVAVSSTTNEAINNLLVKTQSCLEEQGSTALVAKVSSSTGYKADVASLDSSKVQAFKKADIPQDSPVLGATIFTLVEEQYDDAPFDLLVIDEAGQVALSNLLYLSCAARNILLVGDQQQLSQPNRAAHPGDSGRSCLDYVMDNAPVVAPDQGVFLAASWRMPPTLTQLVSELFYDGKLQPAQHNNANRVFWDGPQQGLMFDPVLHRCNSTSSHEEVEYMAQLVERLHGKLYQRARLVNGKLKLSDAVLGSQDILITAPYNMQVNYLKRCLGHKARVGTVDKGLTYDSAGDQNSFLVFDLIDLIWVLNLVRFSLLLIHDIFPYPFLGNGNANYG